MLQRLTIAISFLLLSCCAVGAQGQQVFHFDDSFEQLSSKVDYLQLQLDSLQHDDIGQEYEAGDSLGAGFYAGAAAVFAKPHYKEGFQYSQTNVVTGQQTLVPFEYDYEATPRIWLGHRRDDGFGVKFCFWEFDAGGQSSSNVADGFNLFSAHAVNIIFPATIFAAGPGETLTNNDALKTQIQNYYVTYDTEVKGFEVGGRIGLRYASLEQTLSSTVTSPLNVPIRQLNWKREYDGLGPAIAMEAKRRLGNSPISIVAQAGGSFLFGTKRIERTVLGDQSPQPASPFLTLDDADEVAGIGEIGFGVEASHRCRSGYQLNLTAKYESQLWAEAGAPTLGFLGFEGLTAQIELKH